MRTAASDVLIARLKEAREAAGISQRKLCKLLDRPYTYISKIEEGSRRVDAVELALICEAVGADAAAILGEIIETVRLETAT